MKVFYSFVFFCIICLCSCKQNAAGASDKNTDSVATMKMATDTNNITSSIDSLHNVKNSLDWVGTYKGVIPSKNFVSLKTEITLNSDNTSKISTEPGAAIHDVVGASSVSSGKFEWINESTILFGRTKYAIEENKLVQLDSAGKKVEGADADKYILIKQ